MTAKARKILSRLVVLALLVVAVYWIVSSLKYNNYVKTTGGELLEIVELPEGADEFAHLKVRRPGGSPYLIDRSQIRERAPGVPWINYGIRDIVRKAHWPSLITAVLIFGVAPFLGAVRLRALLGVHDIRPGMWMIVKVTFAGNFFNLLMPGLVMGDVVKAYYLWQHTPKRAEVLMIMLADRFIGVFGLLLVAAGSIAVSVLVGGHADRQVMSWIAGLLLAATAASCAFFSRRLRRLFRVDALIARLPLAETVARLDRALMAMRYHKQAVTAAMFVTIAIHLSILGSASFVGRGFGMEAPVSTYFMIMPLAFVAGAIPILPQGFGQMEIVLIEYFRRAPLEGSVEQACMLAIGARMSQWLWALPGCLVPLFGGHLPSTDKMRREIEAVQREQSVEEPSDSEPPDR